MCIRFNAGRGNFRYLSLPFVCKAGLSSIAFWFQNWQLPYMIVAGCKSKDLVLVIIISMMML